MVRTCGVWLVLLALVVTTGGHWTLLQVCAWTGMLVRNVRTESVTAAVTKTFDGKHPCQLCKMVREGRAEEGRKSALIPIPRLDLFLAQPGIVLEERAVVGEGVRFSSPVRGLSRSDSPPVPPPRVA